MKAMKINHLIVSLLLIHFFPNPMYRIAESIQQIHLMKHLPLSTHFGVKNRKIKWLQM